MTETKISYKELYATMITKYAPGFDILSKRESWVQRLLSIVMSFFNPDYATTYYTQMFGKLWVPSKEIADGIKNSTDLTIKNVALLYHEIEGHAQQKMSSKWFNFKYLFPQGIFIMVLAVTLLLSPLLLTNLLGMWLGGWAFCHVWFWLFSALGISAITMVPKLISARWRYNYELEAYKISLLVYFFYGERDAARRYVYSIADILSGSDYYWTAPGKRRDIQVLLNIWLYQLEDRYTGTRLLPKRYEKVWEELADLSTADKS